MARDDGILIRDYSLESLKATLSTVSLLTPDFPGRIATCAARAWVLENSRQHAAIVRPSFRERRRLFELVPLARRTASRDETESIAPADDVIEAASASSRGLTSAALEALVIRRDYDTIKVSSDNGYEVQVPRTKPKR